MTDDATTSDDIIKALERQLINGIRDASTAYLKACEEAKKMPIEAFVTLISIQRSCADVLEKELLALVEEFKGKSLQ